MTDKEFNQQKKRVQKFWNKWFKTIGLGWFRVEVHWNRLRNEDYPDEVAHTTTNWQYRQAAVTFNLPACVDLNDEVLEEAVIHEMSHILVGGIQDFRDDQAREITEYTVTTVARAILWSREAGSEDAKV
jgi:hypothetical protein